MNKQPNYMRTTNQYDVELIFPSQPPKKKLINNGTHRRIKSIKAKPIISEEEDFFIPMAEE